MQFLIKENLEYFLESNERNLNCLSHEVVVFEVPSDKKRRTTTESKALTSPTFSKNHWKKNTEKSDEIVLGPFLKLLRI